MTLERLLKRAHEGLGDPFRERFLRILKNSESEEKVIELAEALDKGWTRTEWTGMCWADGGATRGGGLTYTDLT